MSSGISYSPSVNQPQYYVVQPQKKDAKPTIIQSGVGVASGVAAYKGSNFLARLCGFSIPHKKVMEIGKSLNQNQIKAFEDNTANVYLKSGLKDKGVEIFDAGKISFDEYWKLSKEKAVKFVEDGPFIRTFCKFFREKYGEKIYKDEIKKYWETVLCREYKTAYNTAIKGLNAFFSPFNNTIVYNKKSPMLISLPHEMGHAINFNNNGIMRKLHFLKMGGLFVPLLMLPTVLLKNKKQEGEQTTGIFDKITTFIKDNCGKLTFLTFLPKLIEEASASIRGTNLSKEFLSKENIKTLKKFYSWAWLTYLGSAVIASLGVTLASKVTDAMKEHYRNQNNKEIQKGQIA